MNTLRNQSILEMARTSSNLAYQDRIRGQSSLGVLFGTNLPTSRPQTFVNSFQPLSGAQLLNLVPVGLSPSFEPHPDLVPANMELAFHTRPDSSAMTAAERAIFSAASLFTRYRHGIEEVRGLLVNSPQQLFSLEFEKELFPGQQVQESMYEAIRLRRRQATRDLERALKLEDPIPHLSTMAPEEPAEEAVHVRPTVAFGTLPIPRKIRTIHLTTKVKAAIPRESLPRSLSIAVSDELEA